MIITVTDHEYSFLTVTSIIPIATARDFALHLTRTSGVISGVTGEINEHLQN